jgi:HK97 family phage portal protein
MALPFPAVGSILRAAVRNLRDSLSDTPDLGLKSFAGGVAFDAITAGWYARNGYPGIYSILSGGMPAWSGEPVSIDTALNHSVVWACNRIISESVGFIPLNMLQRKPGSKEVAAEHPMQSVVHDAPNDETTAQEFRETMTSHTVLGGNAFAQILRRSGTGTAYQLRLLLPGQVTVDREKAGQKRVVYCVKVDEDTEKTYTVTEGKPQDILHLRGIGWDGIRGYSVITMARQSVGTALATDRNVARFYANGGRVPYVLEMSQRFRNDQEFQKFRADWEAAYSEPHRAPILENGTTYKQIGLNFADAQLLESRQFSIPEICRWFLVSPHLVGDLSRATFANIEQLALEFIKMTLATWLTRWEQALWRCVLTPEEKAQGFFFRHNVNALLRGDFPSRMSGYATMLQNGIASVNEVRDLEDWNPVEGGDDHHIQLNMQTLPPGVPLTSQTQPKTAPPVEVEQASLYRVPSKHIA